MFDRITADLVSVLLASLRLGPVFTFAPPFTLIPIPGMVRVVLVVALAAAMINLRPGLADEQVRLPGFAIAALGELSLGIAMALALQLAFSAIAFAGRALDIQAGFGLAFLIDPTTKAQTPLIGAIFTYATAAIFFATSAPYDLLAVLARSFDQVPLGMALAPQKIGGVLSYFGTVSILAFGLVGMAILVLFLIDLVIAMMSRTLPQMNVLVLGFQVKSIVTLLLLPAIIGFAGAGIMRIIRLAIEAMPVIALGAG